ncbi:hypothetical protein C8R43DRAFT_1105795 [Mycena crocata]|nr:hypothetical protein C8R43DRAFT_1105795 [Mycena crocata]
MSPILPPELERYIFELLAIFRPVSIPKLMRVAWRVNHWLEPLLYRTLVIGCDPIDGLPACSLETFRRIADTKSESFLRDTVRNVIVKLVSSRISRDIITTFTGIENLFIIAVGELHTSAHPAPLGLEALPLRHLYCDAEDLFDPTRIQALYLPCFSHITHLELFEALEGDAVQYDDAQTYYAVFADLPRLTHLAFDTTDILPVCETLLQVCKTLCVLVILRIPRIYPEVDMARLAADPRFVMMVVEHYAEDWQRGVLTGEDYWRRAEAFISQRLSGQIDRRTFYLEEDGNVQGDLV